MALIFDASTGSKPAEDEWHDISLAHGWPALERKSASMAFDLKSLYSTEYMCSVLFIVHMPHPLHPPIVYFKLV